MALWGTSQTQLLLQAIAGAQQAQLQQGLVLEKLLRDELRQARTNSVMLRAEVRELNVNVANVDKTLKQILAYVVNAHRAILLPQPGALTLTPIGEEPGSDGMADKIQVRIGLPPVPPAPHDIKALKLTIDGVSELLGLDVLSVDRLVPQGSESTVAAVYVDDAGLESKNPSVLTFTAVDSFEPVDVAGLSVTFLGEVHEEDPVDPVDPVDSSGSGITDPPVEEGGNENEDPAPVE